jgi:hypothetical protein
VRYRKALDGLAVGRAIIGQRIDRKELFKYVSTAAENLIASLQFFAR